MSLSFKSILRTLTFFFVGRYPFVNAITLLLLLAELSTRESKPPIEPKIIYGHLAVFICCGICMGFNFFRKKAAMIHTGQLIYFAFLVIAEEDFKYRRWVTIRMAGRTVGVAGVMMLYAFFTMPKPRDQQLRRIGEILLTIFFAASAYILCNSPEDKTAVMHHFIFGEYMVYIFAIIFAISAFSYCTAMFTFEISQLVIIILIIYTTFIDFNISWWTERRGLDYWNQMRLLCDHACIVLGLSMVILCCKQAGGYKVE